MFEFKSSGRCAKYSEIIGLELGCGVGPDDPVYGPMFEKMDWRIVAKDGSCNEKLSPEECRELDEFFDIEKMQDPYRCLK
jgi:hypothetical protein